MKILTMLAVGFMFFANSVVACDKCQTEKNCVVSCKTRCVERHTDCCTKCKTRCVERHTDCCTKCKTRCVERHTDCCNYTCAAPVVRLKPVCGVCMPVVCYELVHYKVCDLCKPCRCKACCTECVRSTNSSDFNKYILPSPRKRKVEICSIVSDEEVVVVR